MGPLALPGIASESSNATQETIHEQKIDDWRGHRRANGVSGIGAGAEFPVEFRAAGRRAGQSERGHPGPAQLR